MLCLGPIASETTVNRSGSNDISFTRPILFIQSTGAWSVCKEPVAAAVGMQNWRRAASYKCRGLKKALSMCLGLSRTFHCRAAESTRRLGLVIDCGHPPGLAPRLKSTALKRK